MKTNKSQMTKIMRRLQGVQLKAKVHSFWIHKTAYEDCDAITVTIYEKRDTPARSYFFYSFLDAEANEAEYNDMMAFLNTQ